MSLMRILRDVIGIDIEPTEHWKQMVPLAEQPRAHVDAKPPTTIALRPTAVRNGFQPR